MNINKILLGIAVVNVVCYTVRNGSSGYNISCVRQ